MENLEIFKQVTQELVNRGWNASLEYPGFIFVQHDDLTFNLGTADGGDFWGGDVEADRSGGVVPTDVPNTCTDVQVIASALHRAMKACLPQWENCSNELNTYNQIAIRKGDEIRVIADMPYLEDIADDAEVWAVSHKLAEAVADALNKLEAR